ncbi:MAG TPA: 2-oxoacid:acceptor oxidoreductase family protein [Acidimicrobiia bacterium]|nr:2-oxoacid:acceptor oxidoreductase family protein [Acidimicrobiia bacterium]
MERELLITGIGGQGVQLAGQVLARAGTISGHEVMYLGLYGGMMRGGNTDGTVVIADGPISAPPVISRSWSAIALHDEYWPPVEAKLRPGGLVLVNDTTFTATVRPDVTVHRLPATTVAAGLDNPLGGSLVMLAAYCASTGIVGLDALIEGMRASIPPYRTQHIAANERVMRAGWELLPANEFPAWETANV